MPLPWRSKTIWISMLRDIPLSMPNSIFFGPGAEAQRAGSIPDYLAASRRSREPAAVAEEEERAEPVDSPAAAERAASEPPPAAIQSPDSISDGTGTVRLLTSPRCRVSQWSQTRRPAAPHSSRRDFLPGRATRLQ